MNGPEADVNLGSNDDLAPSDWWCGTPRFEGQQFPTNPSIDDSDIYLPNQSNYSILRAMYLLFSPSV
jgi:hypothetical protein